MTESGEDAPHAIGIGAQKAGSSWVFDLLAMHPDVAAASEKELDYFSHRWDRGHGWYRAQFRGRGLRFENSPSYLTDPRAAARVLDLAPSTRVIVTLRDPVDRAISHHLHEVAKGHIPPLPFATALRDNPAYVDQGFYARHLEPWLDAIPRHQMLVLFAEEMRANPPQAAARIHAFLGLPPGPVLAESRNVSDRARLRWLRATLRAGGDGLRRMGAEPALLRLKSLPPVQRVLRWNSRDLRSQVVLPDAAERAALASQYADDMAALAAILGRDSLPWSSFETVSRAVPAMSRHPRYHRPHPVARG